MAYETLARRGELVALAVRDIDFPSEWHRAGAHSARQDGRGRAGEGGVIITGGGEMAEDLAGAREDRGKTSVSSSDGKGANWRTTKCREHCANLQAGCAMAWDARAIR
jgi:hypothetical protein